MLFFLAPIALWAALVHPAHAAELPAEEFEALLRSAAGRAILSDLGITHLPSIEEMRPLAEGLNEIRGRYLDEHPEEADLFEDEPETQTEPLNEHVTALQRQRLHSLVHREGLQSIEFVKAAETFRDYRTNRLNFIAENQGIPADMTPVTDQLDTLQCWAVTATARADVDAGFKLSARYTVYTKTKAEVIDLITGSGKIKSYRGELVENGPFEKIYYEQGGVYADAVEAIRLYGIVPEEAYPGFPRKDSALFEDLNDLFKDFARRIKAGEINRADPAVRVEVEQRVTSILNRHWGKPPETFQFRGKSYDAKGILTEFLPSWQHPQAIELNYAPGAHNAPSITRVFDGAQYRSYKTGNHASLINILSDTLKSPKDFKPVLQYKVINESKTQHDGEIGFAVHKLSKPTQIDWNSKEILDHYVLAIQGEWDQQGNLVRVLIKNTWDTSPSANFGFHWIEADYFSLFEAVEVFPDLEAKFVAKGWLK